MATVRVVTSIAAPPSVCFDVARDMDVHVRSLAHTGERIVGGRASGRIELGETVTFEGRHFGLRLRHSARITAMVSPSHFRDEQIAGMFASFVHDHGFEATPAGTAMTDVVAFRAPFGWLGRAADALVLRAYLVRLLTARGEVIRAAAEATAVSSG